MFILLPHFHAKWNLQYNDAGSPLNISKVPNILDAIKAAANEWFGSGWTQEKAEAHSGLAKQIQLGGLASF